MCFSICQLAGLAVCLLAVVAAHTLHARPPRIGFLAMRGKRNASWHEHEDAGGGAGGDGGPLVTRPRRFTYPLHRLMRLGDLYDELYTRADRTPFGFTGLRGKKAPSGFSGMRGKRVSLGFAGLRGRRIPAGFSGLRGKKIPVGFSGLRGKKIPMGFSGMRGKRPMDASRGPDQMDREESASPEQRLASRLWQLRGTRRQREEEADPADRRLLLGDE